MIKKLNKILDSKENSEKKQFDIKNVFNETLKDLKKVDNNFFGEVVFEFKKGDIKNIYTIDRYNDEQLLKMNKKIYLDLLKTVLSPIKLLSNIDNYTKKERNKLHEKNKRIIDWFFSKILTTNVDTIEESKEKLFLEKRYVHKEKTEKEEMVIYSMYMENVSCKYVSFMSKIDIIEKINVIFDLGQSKDTNQFISCFPEAIMNRQIERDKYDNNVIEKQNNEKLNKYQPRDFIMNCQIEIILSKELKDYEKIVFLDDLKTNGLICTFEESKKNKSPIKLMDLYSLLSKSETKED